MNSPEQLDFLNEQLRPIEDMIASMESDPNLTHEQFLEKEAELNKMQSGIDGDLLRQFEPRMQAIAKRFEKN